jgi:hypothetical protein
LFVFSTGNDPVGNVRACAEEIDQGRGTPAMIEDQNDDWDDE